MQFNTFIIDESIIIINNNIGDFTSLNKIASFDLDYTLIKTKSGRKFPIDKDDWKILNNNIIPKLNELNNLGFKLVIFSNQLGIGKHMSITDMVRKCKNITKLINLPLTFYLSIQDDINRKPRIGMWTEMITEQYFNVDVDNSFYCGDAAGRSSDFSITDYKFALNLNLKFYTPEQLFDNLDNGPNSSAILFDPRNYFKLNCVEFEYSDSINQEVIILVGSPASGKSTLCKEYFSNYTRISQDELKTIPKCKKMIVNAIINNENIIIDATNRSIKARNVWISYIKKINPSITINCINIMMPKLIAMHINCFRKLTSNISIPAIAIHTYYKAFEPPTIAEGFNAINNIEFSINYKLNNNLIETFLN